MTLPASGLITMADVNVEFGRASNTPITLNDSDVRALAGIPSGAISLNDLHGKTYYPYGRCTFFGFVNHGTYGTIYCDIDSAPAFASVVLNLWSTDSGQPTGSTSIGSCNGSGVLNYVHDTAVGDPYWYPAPIINRFFVEVNTHIILSQALTS